MNMSQYYTSLSLASVCLKEEDELVVWDCWPSNSTCFGFNSLFWWLPLVLVRWGLFLWLDFKQVRHYTKGWWILQLWHLRLNWKIRCVRVKDLCVSLNVGRQFFFPSRLYDFLLIIYLLICCGLCVWKRVSLYFSSASVQLCCWL